MITGVSLPTPNADRDARQTQLLNLVKELISKLDPELADHEVNYVRVIKGPAPSILEIECADVKGCVGLFSAKFLEFSVYFVNHVDF
jgi:hypothetical protein